MEAAETNRSRLLYNVAFAEALRWEGYCKGDPGCTIFCNCLRRQGSTFTQSIDVTQKLERRVNETLHWRLALRAE